MRVRTYGRGSIFSVANATKLVEENFSNEKSDLERKMKRVVRWEKRLSELKDPRMLSNVRDLLTRLDELTAKHHISWVQSPDSWSSTIYAKYQRDAVSLDLYVDLDVTPVKLAANFYSRKHNKVALRIFIGKEVRVTDKILACILNG